MKHYAMTKETKTQLGGWKALGKEGTVSKGLTLPASVSDRINHARLKIGEEIGKMPLISEIIREAIQKRINAVNAGGDVKFDQAVRGAEKRSMRSIIIAKEMDVDINQCLMALGRKGRFISASEFIAQALQAHLDAIGV